MSDKKKLNTDDYLNTLEAIASKGSDGFGRAGEVGAVAIGGIAGGGATILPMMVGGGLKATVLGFFGAAALPAMPVVLGGIAAGCAVGYGVSKVIKSGSKQDERRKNMRKELREKIKALGKEQVPKEIDNEQLKTVAEELEAAYKNNKISEEQGRDILEMLQKKKLSTERALQIIKKMGMS